MRKRQLSGTLDFEHNSTDTASTLGICVRTNSVDQAASTTRNVSTLSGGERSFTTMCFQISLWGFIDTPFRCIDEFDVFMDDAFRRRAVSSLLEACDRHPFAQFIFLTPQDMSSMLDDDKKERHIFRMHNPRA